MSDIQTPQAGFSTFTYVTKDGEKCTATKENGIVTIQGDKSGVRQVPEKDFMKELVATLPQVDLARTPNKDTVQFKGGEEKTIDDSSKSNHKVRNWAIGIGTSIVTLIGLGIAGRKGHLGQGLQKFLGGAEKDAGKLADDMTGAAAHTNPHAAIEAEEISAEEFAQAISRESDIGLGQGSRKIPEEKVDQWAREISAELDKEAGSTAAAAGTKAGETVAAKSESAAKSTVKPVNTAPKPETVQPQKTPEQLKKEEIKRRQQIDDDIARQQEEAQKEAERLRREQEEALNNDIINAAVAVDIMNGTGRKAAEKAADTASKSVDKMVEQLAKEADKAAEVTAKADVPKAGTVLEEVIPSAGKTETSAAESVLNSGEKTADDLFTPKVEEDLFTPKTGDGLLAETPKTTFLDDTVDEFGLPKSSVYDDVAEFETPRTTFLDDTVGDYGVPNVTSYEDDVASSLGSGIDDVSGGFDSFGGGIFG